MAGDMLLAAMLDLGVLGAGEEVVRAALVGLGLPAHTLEAQTVVEQGIRATRVEVHPAAGQPFRGPAELARLVSAAPLSEMVRRRAVAAVERLAKVEAEVHGIPVEEVHFHELGAVDTLVDVVGVFVLWEALGGPSVVSAPLPLGSGFVETAHGRLAVPAPATLALCRHLPVSGGPEASELTTPTGALLASELATGWGELPPMQPRHVGYGAGHRKLGSGRPNLVRVILGKGVPSVSFPPWWGLGAEGVLLLEAAVDDMTGEELGHLQEELLTSGATDVWLRPVQMKKNRPGVEVAALVPEELEARLVEVLFRGSSTFGVRRRRVERHCLERSWVEVEVEGVAVKVKVGRWKGEVTTVSPEYESAAAAARALRRPLGMVMAAARAGARAAAELGEGE